LPIEIFGSSPGELPKEAGHGIVSNLSDLPRITGKRYAVDRAMPVSYNQLIFIVKFREGRVMKILHQE
jgi:hypothetical protein